MLPIRVPPNERWVMELFGKYWRTIGGDQTRFVLPLVERIRAKVPVEQIISTDVRAAPSADGMLVNLRAVLKVVRLGLTRVQIAIHA